MTHLEFFNYMIKCLKLDYYEMYLKYIRANYEDRKDLMLRAINYKLRMEPNFICLIPFSLFDKLGIKYELYTEHLYWIDCLTNKLNTEVLYCQKMEG